MELVIRGVFKFIRLYNFLAKTNATWVTPFGCGWWQVSCTCVAIYAAVGLIRARIYVYSIVRADRTFVFMEDTKTNRAETMNPRPVITRYSCYPVSWFAQFVMTWVIFLRRWFYIDMTALWGRILPTFSECANPPIKWNSLILCLSSLRKQYSRFSHNDRLWVFVESSQPATYFSLWHWGLLDCLSSFSLIITNILTTLEAISVLDALGEDENPTNAL